MDGFGRLTDIHYKSGSTYTTSIGSTLAQRQLVYDKAGNLTREQVTQQVYSGSGNATTGVDRSWAYSYDGLGRLTGAATGTFGSNWASPSGAGSGTGIGASNTPFAALGAGALGTAKTLDNQWTLDDLGNWTIGATTNGTATEGLRTRTFNGSSLLTDARRGHRTDDRNQIGTSMSQKIVNDTPDPTAVEVKYAYDSAGRMRYDGRVLYEHDAFGRLVQVRQAPSGVTVNGDGTLGAPAPWTIGALVAHYSYDGLGRVIRTQRPAHSGSTAPANSAKLCITDLYYDGVRVVQEVGWGGNATTGGGAGVPYRTNRDKGGNLSTTLPGLPRRANEMTGTDVSWGDCVLAQSNGGWSWQDRRLEREYIWASDSAAYVDENVAQLVYTSAHTPASGSTSGEAAYKGDDTSATILYTLADHNANVIGLTDALGRLVGQFSYTPYGETRAAEYFAPATGSLTTEEATIAARGNKLGHQGLRTERFDRPWDGAMDLGTSIASGGGSASTGVYRALCHNRNRMYDPAEGRFIEQDPNGLGVATLASMSHRGQILPITHGTKNIRSHYADGLNSHAAYGNGPRSRRDASGLMFGIDATLQVGFATGQMASDLVSQYSINLASDLDWALDWNADDEDHTRNSGRWVTTLMFKSAANSLADAVMGPAALLRDIVRLGQMIGQWYISDGEESLDEEDMFMGHEEPLAGPSMASGTPGSVAGISRLISGLSRDAYQESRKVFKSNRMRYWITEMATNGELYTLEQRAAVAMRRTPKGSDGLPMVIHHIEPLYRSGKNEMSNFRFVTATEHRTNFRAWHPPARPRRRRKEITKYRNQHGTKNNQRSHYGSQIEPVSRCASRSYRRRN